MIDFVSSAAFLAVVTFLWYRKGRLWNFYDALIAKSEKQIIENSIDRKAWEKIAFDQCTELSKELFNSLFRFEIVYLRNRIQTNQHSLWIADSSDDGESQITYTDKAKYCRHILKKIFYADLRFCGLFLFINSVKFKFSMKGEEDPGYVEVKKE